MSATLGTSWAVTETIAKGTYGQPIRGCPNRITIAPLNAPHQLIASVNIRANGDNLDAARMNAQLMASAPRLIEALQEIIETTIATGGRSHSAMALGLADIRERARAAIAKATGERV